jgi:hypothetical protein
MATDMEDETITFYARQQIWQQYAGPYTIRKCLYPWCSRFMNQDNFCVIYYDREPVRDITSIHNLRPVCDVCYSSMRRPTMREWVDYMDHVMGANSGDAQSRPEGTAGLVGTASLVSVCFTNTPLSHGSHTSSDGYVLVSYPSFSDPPDDMES